MDKVHGNKGKKRTEEQIRKWKDSTKGKKRKPMSDEAKRKIGEANKMVFHPYPSEETKKKMSLSRKGHPISDEIKRKIGLANSIKLKGKLAHNKGKHHTPETKLKISQVKKGKPAWNKGIPNTEESKQKMSESKKKLIQELGYVPGGGKSRNTKCEIEAESILQKYNLNYKKQFPIKYLNSYKYYDFYLPDYNILLEIDGTYWHSKNIKDKDITNQILLKTRQNDYIKNKLATDNNYTLIRIWEDEMFKLDDYCSEELNILNKVS